MNSKKHKTKNRAKTHPKAAPDLQENVKVENIENLAQKDSNIQQQSVNIKEEKIESMEEYSEIKEELKEEKAISEVPKKPKRKKGKKKQDTSEEKEIFLPDNSNQQEELNEENAGNKNEVSIALVPARKKKSKNEKNKIHTPEPVLEDSINTLEENIKSETNQASNKIEEQIMIPNLLEPELKETTLAKKKKKKKNRHDSEKSDVNEACTLAFQKLLEPINTDNKNIDVIKVSTLDCTKDVAKKLDVSTTTTENKNIDLIKDSTSDCYKDDVKNIEVSAAGSKEESLKRRKKHKKNKSHPLESELNIEILSKSQELNLVTSPDVTTSNVTLESAQEDTLTKEISPKPKAKIAKPVQKKRKDKSDFQNVEQMPDALTTQIETVESIINKPENIIEKLNEGKDLKDSTNIATLLESGENIEDTKDMAPLPPSDIVKVHDDIVTSDLQDDIKGSSTSEIKSDIKESQLNLENNKESDNIGFVEVKSGKNKKKRLKSNEAKPEDVKNSIMQIDQSKEENKSITQREQNRDEIFYDIPHLDIEENSKPGKDLKDSTNIATLLESGENIEDTKDMAPLPPSDIAQVYDDIVTSNLKDDTKGNSTTEIKSDIKESQQNLETNKESDNLGFVEVKTGKNKKKRLKSNEAKPEDVKNSTMQIDQSKEENKNITQREENKDEIFYDIPHLDIEENSKPDDLEGLKIVTPDLIQYPRSTSQLNIDSNNNTIIQEITITDEVKLGIPIIVPTPIIEGSGETPDVKFTGDPITIKELKVQAMPNKDNEKTDIKSKMFEVNKEMEELRRSIERSLAELTGTEKCDSKVDSAFEELFQSQIKEQLPSTSRYGKSVNEKNAKTNTKGSENKSLKEIDVATVETPSENIAKVQSGKCEVESSPPICPVRSKSKGKSKRKGKKDTLPASSSNTSESQEQGSSSSNQESKTTESKSSEKPEQNTTKGASQEKGKQKSSQSKGDGETSKNLSLDLSFEPIENFEDALTSSADDVNKTFEIIASEVTLASETVQHQNTPQINVIAPSEDGDENVKKDSKTQNPMSQPKNLLGHPNIPVSSNKNDYKKEKNKPPNSIQAKVKIKDSNEIEMPEKQNSTQIKKLTKDANGHDAYSYMSNENEDFVYKYSFRKVFLQSACHVCKKDLIQRIPCKFCSLVFYCSQKHKDEDCPKHQSLCFAVSTIAHLKDQKFIYADAQDITGLEYRVLRMQMILSCEKILKRKLVPWEQEALLYPRICGDIGCREWKQSRLKDCEGCGQISYCTDHPEHLPSTHKQWCKSYSLFQKLVNYQQTKGRLVPKLPTKVLSHYRIPENLNQVLGSLYEEKIDMDDIQYAALTQIATAPLTTAYCYQLYKNKNSTNANGLSKKSTFTIHTIATDLHFEADSLNKWEIFFHHLFEVQDLRVVLVGPELNSSGLPLDILGKIRLCENCKTNRRRVIFDFHDKQSYEDYYSSDDFITPDIVCAFNPSIQRASTYKVENTWPSTLNYVLKQRVPFLLTSYTLNELKRDIDCIKECSKINFNVISDIKRNPFCSVRPDRNFITDHEMPLLFKNYYFSVLCGV